VGKLLDRYQSQFAGTAEDTNADGRAEASRIQEAHAIGADIDQLAAKLQRHWRPHTVDETRVTVIDEAGTEVTIDVLESDATDPGILFRVASSEGAIAEYDEDGLFEFLIDWIQTRPDTTSPDGAHVVGAL
jgi:hypothetical protein